MLMLIDSRREHGVLWRVRDRVAVSEEGVMRRASVWVVIETSLLGVLHLRWLSADDGFGLRLWCCPETWNSENRSIGNLKNNRVSSLGGLNPDQENWKPQTIPAGIPGGMASILEVGYCGGGWAAGGLRRGRDVIRELGRDEMRAKQNQVGGWTRYTLYQESLMRELFWGEAED